MSLRGIGVRPLVGSETSWAGTTQSRARDPAMETCDRCVQPFPPRQIYFDGKFFLCPFCRRQLVEVNR